MSVKNTGIKENQLSDFDMGSVLKDSHNKEQNALDINQVNSLVPSKFDTIELTYDVNENITVAKYYGLGKQEIFTIAIRDTPQGSAEITTFPFTSSTPAGLGGKYLIIYDDVGSVGVWFDLDNGSTPPTTGAARDIEIDIATGDSTTDLATKFATTMNSDSKFAGTTVSSLAVIQVSTIGNKTDATTGTSGITPSITQGVNSLEGKFFYIYNRDDNIKYGWYYTIDGSGSEPSNDADVMTVVPILSSDDIGEIATKTSVIVNNNDYLSCDSSGSSFIVTELQNGNTTGFEDGDSGFTSNTDQEGEASQLVATVYMSYDVNNNITKIERV